VAADVQSLADSTGNCSLTDSGHGLSDDSDQHSRLLALSTFRPAPAASASAFTHVAHLLVLLARFTDMGVSLAKVSEGPNQSIWGTTPRMHSQRPCWGGRGSG